MEPGEFVEIGPGHSMRRTITSQMEQAMKDHPGSWMFIGSASPGSQMSKPRYLGDDFEITRRDNGAGTDIFCRYNP